MINIPLPSPNGDTSAWIEFLSVGFLTLNELDLSFYKIGNINNNINK